MRKILITFVVMVAASVMTGCAPSLHPFFTDANIIFNDQLLGEWKNDSGEICKFTKSGEDSYEFLYVDKDAAKFKARLIELDGENYLDLYPDDSDHGLARYLGNIVLAHILARVNITKDTISLEMLNGDWISKLSERNQLELSYERLADGSIVLTASTPDLQTFVLKHANDRESFGDADVYYRRPNDE